MTARQKRKDRITAARQKQILGAALSVFSSKGFGESTVADVAQAAGIGVGTIYNYYKDKHDLLISAISRSLVSSNFLRILDNIPMKATQQQNEDFLQSLLEDRIEFAFRNVTRMVFVFVEIQRDPALRKQYMNRVMLPLIGRIEDYIHSQVERGSFRPVDGKIAARTLIGSIIGCAMLYKLEAKDSPFKQAGIKYTAMQLRSLFTEGLTAVDHEDRTL
jgi:AcrR family transcriptional regulator